SLLDGACRIDGLMDRLRAIGQDAVAITDHGAMFGVVDFYKAARAAGVKPIIGCEVYVAPRSRHDKTHDLDRERYHLILLCENRTGYRNLCQLVSRAYTEGFYVKPRVDRDLLAQYHEGLICLSACLYGEVSRNILRGQYEEAKKAALWYRGIFGDGNYFLEIQDHGLPESQEAARGVLRLGAEAGIPLVLTNDAHYLTREGAYTQDVLMCIQMNRTVDDPDRLRFRSSELYVKSGEEMGALFPHHPEAMKNTRRIADRCNVEFTFGERHLPQFTLPEGQGDSAAYLRRLAEEGFARRYPGDPPDGTPGSPPDGPPGYRQRLAYELAMIERMGFVDYFLIVSDFIGYARRRGIPVGPGRGSAAGSIVSYCLRITDVDPMKYELYFERFLNPERVSMPDIDIDFCYIRRQEVIDYVVGKYGADRVAQIVTFGTMAARAVIRDVGRVLGYTYAEVDVVAKMVPFAVHMTLDTALKASPQLHDAVQNDPRVARLIDTAKALEGMPRHASTHAAGVVITALPVSTYVPLATNEEAVVTQFPMNTLEELGLLKMDFLGLRNLTVISDTERMAREGQDPLFRLADIPEDDPETFAMLAQGKTAGVFQLESAGMTGVCVGLVPQSIEDITAVVALYRPGPMDSIPRFIDSKRHPEKVTYKHPMLRDILRVTYGCIVYQEQVLEIFRRLAGFSLGKADMVRRAMSKKKVAELARERENFIHGNPSENIPGAVRIGVDARTAQGIFDEIMDFANYAFNKAHAVSYAVIAYQTAYLKCHYPQAYMAALLTSVLDWSGKVAEYVVACQEMGIRVAPPDINKSEAGFSVSPEGDILFGLVAVKNVGRAYIQALLADRAQNGPFSSFFSFCARMFARDANRRAVESLIKSGAMDRFGASRLALIDAYGVVLSDLETRRRRNLEGQFSLFGDTDEVGVEAPLSGAQEDSVRDRLAMEKECTGLYLSGHPLDAFRTELRRVGGPPLRRILDDFAQEEGVPRVFRDGQRVTVAGLLTSVRTKTTRNNSLMAYANLEDATATVELLVFAGALGRCGSYLSEDKAVVVTGRISAREDREPTILVDELRPLSDLATLSAAALSPTVLPPTALSPATPTPVAPASVSSAPVTSAPVASAAVASAAVASSASVASAPVPPVAETEKKLYLKLSMKSHPKANRLRALLNMFPGAMPVVICDSDTGRRLGAVCAADDRLLRELRDWYGAENVVMKL
ncbi:MAG: DNA polymerase III subunit alpha, partial [Oscillospiraceae bacterium]|nr:DNA polymerase III subunit alpha [Oscillospiraceae bacterium]